ncbi:MAG: type II secretion system protein [Verrucomicrobia bacterium]|nr:type II secretion system protein [Verrucomicrobiota bacterium]
MDNLRRPKRRGFSLIELLCVIAILAILASLLASSVLRAYRRVKQMQTSLEAPGLADLVEKKLKDFFAPKARFPAYTAEELHEHGVFDREMMRRIRARELIYYPFSSTDPDNKLIAEVLVEKKPQTLIYQRIWKKDLYAEER